VKITNEKGVKKAVKALFDKYGWFWWMPPANAYGKVGISDFHAIKDHVFMVVETKFGSNKPTPPQRAFLESIMSEGCGGYAFVVNEKNLDQFEAFLRHFKEQVAEIRENKRMSSEAGAAMVDALRALTALI
jgi:hypothetical protein